MPSRDGAGYVVAKQYNPRPRPSGRCRCRLRRPTLRSHGHIQRDRFETPMMPSPNSQIRRPRPSGGFTLVELLIGLAIAGMLITLATPHWRSLIAAAELRERALALVGAMSVARSEAIKRGTRVHLCPSADRTRCAGALGWDAGWLAYANEPA